MGEVDGKGRIALGEREDFVRPLISWKWKEKDHHSVWIFSKLAYNLNVAADSCLRLEKALEDENYY